MGEAKAQTQTVIASRIQHHPSRNHLLPPLLDSLAGLNPEVITHSSEPPNPWAGYRLCLADPPDCSHLLIVQDDATPCENAVPAIAQIAAAHPDEPVCLFISRLPDNTTPKVRDAMRMNRRYVTLGWRKFLPVVATLWPRHKAVEFLEWAKLNPHMPGQRDPISDDGMAGRWKMLTRQTVLATVPSLFEHPDCEPSFSGPKREKWGKDRGRVAVFMADDALDYDWSMP